MRLTAFGGLGISASTRALGGAAAQRRPLALLLLLSTAGDGALSRDKITGLLWPESDRERARNALRQTLHVLRRDLDEPELVTGTTDLRLNHSLLSCDVCEFDAALAVGDHRAAIELYAGPLADGFYLDDANEFERWLEEERDRRRRRFAHAIESLATSLTAKGDHSEASALWRRLTSEQPLDSRVAARLMQALADAGDIPGALQHARVHGMLVRQELEVEADPAVTRLVDVLRARLAQTAVRRDPQPEAASAPASIVESGPRLLIEAPKRSQRRVPRWTAVPLVAALVVATAWATRSLRADNAMPNSYAVFPFAHEGADPARLLSGNQCAELLQDAFGQWKDLRVVDGLRLSDAMAREPSGADLHARLEMARHLGARYAVAGSISPLGDSLYLRAGLFDVRDGRTLRSVTMTIGRDLRGIGNRFHMLASLLLQRESGEPAADGPIATTSLEAWRAYDRARMSMASFGYDSAMADLRRATMLDAKFALAWLELAHAAAWSGGAHAREAREAAGRSLALRAQLPLRRQKLADAIGLLTSGRYAEACDRFDAMLRDDSTSIDALYGLAECNISDSVVVADAQSVTGMRFRGSMHVAEQSLGRALDQAPALLSIFREQAFAKLTQSLYVDARRVRVGVFVNGRDTVRVAAFPNLDADTLVFIPRTADNLRVLASDTSHLLALQRNRRLLLERTVAWTRAHPNSADAWEANALALESIGALTSTSGESARESVSRARRAMAQDSTRFGVERFVRLAAADIRLAIKTGDYAYARTAADSVLASSESVDASTSARLSGLAALTGRVERTAVLMGAVAPIYSSVDASGRATAVTQGTREASLRLFAYSAFPNTRDSVRAQERVVNRFIAATVAPALQNSVRLAVMSQSLRLKFEDMESARSLPADARIDALLDMHRARARGDTTELRALLRQQIARRAAISAADLTFDVAFQEARLALALRDTMLSIAMLDRALDAVPVQAANLVENPYMASSLVRSMALRAELASARRERDLARRWASAVETLWSGGDRVVQPTVARMREVLRSAER